MLKFVKRSNLPLTVSRSLHTSKRRQGYIVLVPEIGEEGHAAESLVKPDGLPAFNEITIENCLGSIGQQAAAIETTVKSIENEIIQNAGKIDPPRIFNQLEEASGPLDTTWGIAKAIYLGNSTLIPTKSYMNIHERARNVRASKFCNKVLFDALDKFSEQDKSVTSEQNNDDKRLLQKFLLEGRLNGLTLSKNEHDGLKQVLMQLGKERGQFKNKVNMSVHTFTHHINDLQLVREFPATLLEAIAKDPNQPMNGPWKITLQPQIVDGFLKYCPDRTQRWNIWQANVRKASSQMEKSLENSTHLEKIRALRLRQANILGYKTFADLSMQTKMVGSVSNLKKVFNQLLEYAGPAQNKELEDLHKFAKECGAEQNLDLYDISFWQRKYLLSKYEIDEEKLREYFPLPRVFSGIFSLSEKLFDIKIVERKDAQVWQPAVKYFDVFDSDKDGGKIPIAGFYIDCYSKENRLGKNNGWMVGIRNKNKAANLTPLCALIFNFSEPLYGKPYLLNYDDLCMVLKTFGSAMQHLLTNASYSDLAGLSNIEWDASQVSGYVMSNFIDNTTILKSISGHFANDEPLPDNKALTMNMLKTNMAGYKLCQELYFADLDIELHQSKDFWLDVVRRTWPLYRCLPLDKKDCHPCSMTEIFSGDWAAAQFSHLYSKMIAADITAAFSENDANAKDVGKRFKRTFLTLGGSVPSCEVFRRFRGRDPSVEALLKSLNILNPTQTTENL